MSRHLVREPWFILREIPSFYVAWLSGWSIPPKSPVHAKVSGPLS